MEPLDRIPDGIEPIVGFRVWVYALHGSRAELHPMRSFGNATGPSPWDGAESGWVFASCAADPVDLEHVPGWSCTCGFYATKSLGVPRLVPFLPKGILALAPPCEDGVERGWIFGRVKLAGKIIEHDYGYRAQRARIAELNPLEGDERNGFHLAAFLGLPIGDPVPVVAMPLSPNPPWSPPFGPSTPRLRVRDWVQDQAA
jgi:hypothetical protein